MASCTGEQIRLQRRTIDSVIRRHNVSDQPGHAAGIRCGTRCHVADHRVPEQQFLELGGVDVDPADDLDVIETPGDLHVPVTIEHRDVARWIPEARRDGSKLMNARAWEGERGSLYEQPSFAPLGKIVARFVHHSDPVRGQRLPDRAEPT